MTTQTLKTADPASWRSAAARKSAHGAWYIAIDPLAIQLSTEPLTAPFGLSSWTEGSQRVNLDLRCTDELREFANLVDAWVWREAWAQRETVLPNVQEGASHSRHKSCLSQNGLLRTKVDLDRVKVWRRTPDGEICPATPEDIACRDAQVTPIVKPARIWTSASQFGIALECTSILVHAARPDDIPFIL